MSWQCKECKSETIGMMAYSGLCDPCWRRANGYSEEQEILVQKNMAEERIKNMEFRNRLFREGLQF